VNKNAIGNFFEPSCIAAMRLLLRRTLVLYIFIGHLFTTFVYVEAVETVTQQKL